jgi:ribonuclease P protein component
MCVGDKAADKGVSDLKLPKSMLLAKPWQYDTVYRQGKRLRGRDFSVILRPNGLPASRLGVSVHGVKQAVRRNRIKRIIREFFRQNRSFFCPASDVVFAVRSGFGLNSTGEVCAAVRKLMGQFEAAG